MFQISKQEIAVYNRNYKITVDTVELAPIWQGQTVVCIGGGHSLTADDVQAVRDIKTIGINNAYLLAPWLDILYACDAGWWEWHDGYLGFFKGFKLQHCYDYFAEHTTRSYPYAGIPAILSSGVSGFDDNPSRIRHGYNGGYQALHIAMHLNASKIILLGYDMYVADKSHWFGEHPNQTPYNANIKYAEWIKEFPALKEAADKRGQRIINCTPNSRLKCFEMMSLIDALK